MWKTDYLYLAGLAILTLSNTILMVMLLVERRENKRLRRVANEFSQFRIFFEQYKHLEELSKNGGFKRGNKAIDNSYLM